MNTDDRLERFARRAVRQLAGERVEDDMPVHDREPWPTQVRPSAPPPSGDPDLGPQPAEDRG